MSLISCYQTYKPASICIHPSLVPVKRLFLFFLLEPLPLSESHPLLSFQEPYIRKKILLLLSLRCVELFSQKCPYVKAAYL